MRVAFCGKGGSGKTSMAALFIQYLINQNQSVLAIDGDINQHLGGALGFDPKIIYELPKLGQRQVFMKEYLCGNNPRIRQAADMIEATPAGTGSQFVTRDGQDLVSQMFMIYQGHLRFMAIGGHDESDAGTTCFHKFTGAEGVFLNHYLDAQDEYVIADMCAGADPFSSSGLATRFDASVVVIEPTLKSIAVFQQAKMYGEPNQVTLLPVANKIMSPDDLQFIENHIGQACICAFRSIDQIRNAEKGIPWTVADLEADTMTALGALQKAILNLPARNWDHYQAIGRMFHQKAADGWATAMYGYDMTEQYDPDFKYPSANPTLSRAA